MTTYSYSSILDEVKTVEDLRLVASEIDMLLVTLYKTDKEIFVKRLHTKLQRNLTDSLTLSLNQQNVSLENHEQLQQYFTGLKQFLAALPLLQLTIPYHPSNEQVEKLSDWARRETNKPVILQIQYNPTLLGGAVITYEGRYTDLSLKKKLDAVYATKKEEILAILK